MSTTNPHLIWSPEELAGRAGEPNLRIVDMRTPEEFATGHVPGAVSFDIFGITFPLLSSCLIISVLNC